MNTKAHTTPCVRAVANRRDGYVIPMVMMFLIIISLMGIGLLSMAGMELELYKRTEASRQAFFLAEAGAQRTQALLAVEGDWETSPGANVVFSEESFQDGTYTVHLENVSAGEATIVAEGTYPRTGTLRTTRRVRLVVER